MKTNRSFRPTRSTRPSRYSRGSRALALSSASAAGVAALLFAGNASADQVRASAPQRVEAVTTIKALPDRPVQVEHQVGTVLEGTADTGTPVMLFLYENSLHGSSIQVVLGDPEDDNIGHVEQGEAFITDGVLDVTVDVGGTPVRFQGTVSPDGRPEKVVEPLQDNGERIVTKGTNTQLAADVSVTVGGTTAPMSFAPAFAFDLESRKVTLYGR
jgi:hypothetical protein